MSKPFKLSCTLLGHSLDVRGVCAASGDCIVSGSRDKTAKFWRPNGFNTGFSDVMTYRDQTKFVASVLFLEPSTKFPDGLVLTGGNDNVILGYKPGEPFATFQLKEHTNTVCRLTKGLEPNTFLSASWDQSAKLWSLESTSSLASFLGHSAAVWGVIQISNGNIVTASADKTIGIYSNSGTRLQTIQAHNDCVRDLADFPELNCFISVSNDASIKVWSYAGESLQTYYGHNNFIYCIARNKAGGNNCFVTSDEDRTVRYWLDGVNTEIIRLPTQSVWSVACLNNGDIVTGSSDGVVRVFTQDESRYASSEALVEFEKASEALEKQMCQEIGGYKVSDLPGKEALYEPGKKAGQMKMVREGDGVVAYTWVEDGQNNHWEKVGDVLGGTTKDNEGKTTFEGKSYDFVFSVDVEDGKPPIKLPYNKGDDPYVAAHEFLSKNFLPASYLEQVVDFIMKNSGQQNLPPANSSYVDPFTGGARYVPSSSNGGNASAGQNVDPFTGASSYTSNLSAQTNATTSAGQNVDPFTGASSYSSKPSDENAYFPINTYRSFDMGDSNVILEKLKEFNKKVGDKSLEEDIISNAVKQSISSPNENAAFTLFKLLEWPEDFVFPVIDVMRLAVKSELNNKIIATHEGGMILNIMRPFIKQTHTIVANKLVSLRFICNLMLHSFGEELVFNNRVELLELFTNLGTSTKTLEIALATVLLNICVMCLKRDDDVGIEILTSILPQIVVRFADGEAQFRAFVAIGTLISSKQSNIIKQQLRNNIEFLDFLDKSATQYGSETELKRKQCASQVQNKLFN